jgi:hypothetical protein
MKAATFTFNPITIHTKKLIPLDEYIPIVLNKRISDKDKLKSIKDYTEFLSTTPERTDFINFDDEGFYLDNNEPMFKGFITCEESSSEEKKVALKDNTRIYFYASDNKGVVLYHANFVTDECTYNEIAIGFNAKNGMKPLVFK